MSGSDACGRERAKREASEDVLLTDLDRACIGWSDDVYKTIETVHEVQRPFRDHPDDLT
jgi:hypothetical protein